VPFLKKCKPKNPNDFRKNQRTRMRPMKGLAHQLVLRPEPPCWRFRHKQEISNSRIALCFSDYTGFKIRLIPSILDGTLIVTFQTSQGGPYISKAGI
jgi:hypothetical protein